VGLELGIADVPHLIGYKVNFLTYRLVRSKITTNYAHLVNILQGKEVVPEFIQENCKAEPIAAAFKQVMQDSTQQKAAFSQIREMLASDRQNMKAADFIASEVMAA
ncbi:MAG TPA: lipid-A-disaccharide synthase, partial [Micavibrio sp.]|nr:lipid-A-disaccharide synthase [Micavibrio sp.]